MKTVLLYAGLAAAVPIAACASSDEPEAPRQQTAAQATSPAPAPNDTRPVVLFVGTSLTAGFGLDPTQAYPALVQRKIDSAGLDYQAVNAGVSGQTSAGALSGIDWLLQRPVAVMVIETGGNDGLRGIDPADLRGNIEGIILRARAQDPPPAILLTGMEAPPNLGPSYTSAFRAVYSDLAEAYDLAFVPFLLDGIAGVDSLNQADGIHPTPEGQRLMADYVWTALLPLLTR